MWFAMIAESTKVIFQFFVYQSNSVSCSISMAGVLRNNRNCQVLGTLCPLRMEYLPTLMDILRSLVLDVNQSKESGKVRSVASVIDALSKKVKCIWEKAGIPTITHNAIVLRISRAFKKYTSILKSINKNYFQSTVEQFKNDSIKLFDIASCKCDLRKRCYCEKEFRVLNKQFLLDQRSERRLENNSTCTVPPSKASKRKREESPLKEPSSPKILNPDSPFLGTASDPIHALEAKNITLTNVILEMERYGVSQRATASICSALLLDIGIVTEIDFASVIDRSKIQRERKKVHSEIIGKS